MMTQTQLADLEAAQEFSTAIALQVAKSTQVSLVEKLAERRQRAVALIDRLDEGPEIFSQLCGFIFGVRRHRRELMAQADLAVLIDGIELAKKGEDPLVVFTTIGGCGYEDQGLLRDLTSEVLHIVDPLTHPLWRRWVLDPEQETGALALIVEDPVVLYGIDDAKTYAQVRFASEYLRQTLSAASLLPVSAEQSPYGLDVFLAGVYGIYSSTVIKMRMTKEFNSLLPDLGEFMGRILGVKGEVDANRGY
ncbi:MAG: hypothetical protein ACP5HZ_08775 [Ferrimicrobium sp.]|uniref:hypothetical protein n=1 Tax=Ferrimicrobium sp. TaxID=2926050 RepID=UPI00262C1A3A|nr:hypothetical protein [Ferrimicrobium sp.]